jgi:hypothetical protein
VGEVLLVVVRSICWQCAGDRRSLAYPLNRIKETSVSSAKESMLDLIGRQPDDSSYDEILRELAFARMVQRGVDDSDAGQTLSDDDMKRKIDSWQK